VVIGCRLEPDVVFVAGILKKKSANGSGAMNPSVCVISRQIDMAVTEKNTPVHKGME
jgi:hypothetical protein